MGLRKLLLALERRFAWGFIGFVTGTLLGIAGIYYALKERAPNVTFEIIGEFNVLDVRQPLPDLRIAFQGQDIQRSSLNLRILRVRIVNDGEADVLQAHFDNSSNWGATTRAARLLEARLVDASSPYLDSSARPLLISDSIVEFPKVILERGQSFTVELLLLHPKAQEPRLLPVGKIAGVDAIHVVERLEGREAVSVLRTATSGSAWVQLIRALMYSIASFLVLILIGGLIGGAGAVLGSLAQRRRRREITLILETRSPEEVVAKELLVEIYGQLGLRALQRVSNTISTEGFSERARLDLLFDVTFEMSIPRPARHHRHDLGLLARSDDQLLTSHELISQLRKRRLLVSSADGTTSVHPAFLRLLRVALDKLGGATPIAPDQSTGEDDLLAEGQTGETGST